MERKQSVCHALLPAYLLSAFFIRMISNLLGAQTADYFCRQLPDLQQSLAIVRTDLLFFPYSCSTKNSASKNNERSHPHDSIQAAIQNSMNYEKQLPRIYDSFY